MSENKDNHGFSVVVAQEIGVNRAIMLQHFKHLQIAFLDKEKSAKDVWVKRSRRALSETYPYFTEKEIRGCLDRLERDEYIRAKVDNALNYDRTKSYQLDKKGWDLMGDPASDKRANRKEKASDKRANGFDERANDNLTKGPMNIGSCSSVVTSFVEGERTPPAHNPSNLQSQKSESGLVAPAEPLRLSKEQIDYLQSEARKEKAPPVAPTPPDEDEDAFAQWLPSLHTAMENNAPGAMPMPTHIVTETTDDPNIRITTGVNLSEPVTKTITFPQNTPRPLRYDEYPNPRNANELKDRLKEYFTHHPEDWRLLIENAKVNWMPEKLEETTLAYCLHQEKEGNMKRTYNTYKAGLTTWFMRQKSWDAQNNAPKEGGQTRQNGQPEKTLISNMRQL